MLKYAITLDMSRDQYNEYFTTWGKTAIAKSGDAWEIIDLGEKLVKLGKYPSFFVDHSKAVH